MTKSLTAVAILLCLSQPALATNSYYTATEADKREASKNELVGVGAGVAAGAAIAGPVGAVVMGVIGLVAADDMNDRQQHQREVSAVEAKLQQQQQQYAQLQQAHQDLLLAMNEQQNTSGKSDWVTASQSSTQPATSPQVQQSIISMVSNVQFQTNSAQLEHHYQKQLLQLAKQLQSAPELQLTLSGYADRRGDEAHNQVLSERRVAAVKAFLLQNGVAEQQIATASYGEQQPLVSQQSRETDFFDRRVVLDITPNHDVMTAANQ